MVRSLSLVVQISSWILAGAPKNKLGAIHLRGRDQKIGTELGAHYWCMSMAQMCSRQERLRAAWAGTVQSSQGLLPTGT